MKVYRLASLEEMDKFLDSIEVGHKFINNPKKNTHKYKLNVNYMHFFYNYYDIFNLSVLKNNILCTYDFPDSYEIYKGIGYYLDPITFTHLMNVDELAIESTKVKTNNLEDMKIFIEDLDFEDYIYQDIYPSVRNITKEMVKKLVKVKN